MNSRRAANRARSSKGNSRHMSYDSPASLGASKGGGSHEGAGEMPAIGPGKAASRYMGRDAGTTPMTPTPPGTAPKGMKTYAEE